MLLAKCHIVEDQWSSAYYIFEIIFPSTINEDKTNSISQELILKYYKELILNHKSRPTQFPNVDIKKLGCIPNIF